MEAKLDIFTVLSKQGTAVEKAGSGVQFPRQ